MATKVSYNLQGLDCADCAAQIQDRLPPAGDERGGGQLRHRPAAPARGTAGPARAVIREVDPKVTVLDPTEQAGPDEEDDDGIPTWRRIAEMAAAAVLLVAGAVFHDALHASPWAEYAVFVPAYPWWGGRPAGRPAKPRAGPAVRRELPHDRRDPRGVPAIHELPEAVAVMLFDAVGEYFQDRAVGRSRRSIRALLAVRPDHATVRRGDRRPGEPRVGGRGRGDLVRPGKRIPLDGEVIEGSTYVDTSALTGESAPGVAGAATRCWRAR